MKKRVIAVLILASVLSLTACKDKEDKNADAVNSDNTVVEEEAASVEESETDSKAEASVSVIADDLLNNIKYADELTALDPDVASMVIDFGGAGIVESIVYESSGATAEEIVVVECSSESDASTVKSVLKSRVEEQKISYEDYVPEELVKLDAAIVVQNGNFAVLSVSDEPDKAKEILSKYF